MQRHKSQVTNKSIQNIKAAFFDIDGTIFKADFTISKPVIEAFKKLQSLGIKTCLATGRPYFGCKQIIEALKITDPSMFFSGSYVISPSTHNVIFDCALSSSETDSFLEELKQNNIYTEIYTADKYFIEEETPLTEIHNQYLKLEPVIDNFSNVTAREHILKLVAISNTPEELSTLKDISKKYPTLHHAFSSGASHPDLCFLNVTSQRASRESAFNAMVNHFNISPSETIAFGDSDADIPFIQLSGIGVAVGNATKAAQIAADYISPSVEEDGVVYALEYMGL